MACKHRVLPVFRASNSTQFTVICCPALQSFILSHGTRESRDRGGNKYPSLWIGTWCQRKALWLTEVWNDGRLGDGLWPPRVGGNGEEYILNIHEMWTQDSVYHGYDPSLFGLMEWKNVCFLSLDTTSSGQQGQTGTSALFQHSCRHCTTVWWKEELCRTANPPNYQLIYVSTTACCH